MRIIVNADDLGQSREVNAAIGEFMSRGYVSSATILANAPEVDDALRVIRALPNCSFGVHLNATQFRPISSAPGLRSLLNDNGMFVRAIEHIWPTPRVLAAVYEEFCAQVSLLLKRQINVSHIDSHHHVHNLPYLFPVLKAVQRRFGIRKVRLTKNLYRSTEKLRPLKRVEKNIFIWSLRNLYLTTTTAGFTDFLTFHDLIRSPFSLDSVELMVHPGGGAAYVKEAALLRADWLDCVRPSAKMINYHQL